MSVNISITGDKEIDQVLRQLPLAMSNRIMGTVNYQAAQIVVQKEKLLVPEGPTGNLVDSIGATKVSLSKAKEIGEVIVGPRRKNGYKGFAGHLVEFGTTSRYTTGKKSVKAGAYRGRMKKKAFAKPTFDATKGQVETFIAAKNREIVIKTMKRYIK